MESKFISGRITLPKEIREYLSLQPGDKVEFFLRSDGSVGLSRSRPGTIRFKISNAVLTA